MGRRLALHAPVDAGPAGDVRADSRLIQKGRRARQAGIRTSIGCHSFRATGITNYLEKGGTLEEAPQMPGHESPKTTKLYDRTSDQITLDEVEWNRHLTPRLRPRCGKASDRERSSTAL
ncbi:MAG TPA: hypothetical protein VF590_00340 [Isosphaeraceae bacterium]|jgi:integrase